jgi:hypothetical protein
VGAIVVTWFVVAPHIERLAKWPTIAIATLGVIPVTLSLVLIALPLWTKTRSLVAATIVLALVALVCSFADWGLEGNFAKLWAAVFAGWAFLTLFERLSWVVLVAVIVPVVDLLSVWRGPTKVITEHHFEVYTAVAIAFVLPGGEAFSFGPPDILFFGLFLGAAARWNLRIVRTWIAMTAMYSLTVVIATNTRFNGLAGLPFLSFGFLVANADVLWRRLRSPEDLSDSASLSSSGDGPVSS